MAFSHLFIYHGALGVPSKSCGDEKRSLSLDTLWIFLARQSQIAASQGRSGQAERVSGQHLLFECSKRWRQDFPSHRTATCGTSTGVVISSTHPWQLQSSLACVCACSPPHWPSERIDGRCLATGVILVLKSCWDWVLPWPFQHLSDIPSDVPPTHRSATRAGEGAARSLCSPPCRAHMERCLQLLPWDPCWT